MEIFELIKSSNTFYGSITLAKAIGVNESIIFSALISKENYYNNLGHLDDEEMFYSTAADIEDSTALTQRQQEKAINHLVKLNLITTKIKGMPAKKYFSINKNTEILIGILRRQIECEKTKKILTKDESKFQHKNESNLNEISKQASTKSENMVQQNVEENIYNKNNNKYNKEKTAEQVQLKESKNECVGAGENKSAKEESEKVKTAITPKRHSPSQRISNNYENIINKFTRDENTKSALWEYIKMRIGKKATPTDYALELVLKHLGELSENPDIQAAILNQSTVNNWTYIFPLREKKTDSGYVPSSKQIPKPTGLVIETNETKYATNMSDEFWDKLMGGNANNG